jgi:glycosyltransferase involved in cell wall biosynthesis
MSGPVVNLPPSSARADPRLHPLSRLPDVIGPLHPPAHRRARVVTPILGPLRYAFSGISWHFAEAALAEGVLEGACALSDGAKGRNQRLYAAGALWKAQRLLRQRKMGGYKFHPQYHNVLWAQYIPAFADTLLLNHCQLLGPYFRRHYEKHRITPCFHIDGTFSEYFETYAAAGDSVITIVGEDVLKRAISVEREDYACAARIIAMSRATERTLQTVYGVPPERIAFVMPGANLPDAMVPPPSPHKGWVGEEFTVGFVGFYPLRKGLPTLARAVQILRGRKLPIRLRAIGRCPPEIATMDGVDYLGEMDKAKDVEQFIAALGSVDLGCQLSRADLTGIAMFEFLRLGVPFLATNIGGMADVAAGGGGLTVSPPINAEQLAEVLTGLITDRERYQRLREAAIARAEWASWRRVARECDAALAPLG